MLKRQSYGNFFLIYLMIILLTLDVYCINIRILLICVWKYKSKFNW